MGTRIGLVTQTKRRRGGICRARDQYGPSPIFRRARDFCEREHGEWYIISTRHGLVSPRQVIGPDSPQIHTMSPEERWCWAHRVAEQLQLRIERTGDPIVFVLYASQQYADLLIRAAPFADFELPLSGMTFWERLQWYDERLRIQPRVLSHACRPATT